MIVRFYCKDRATHEPLQLSSECNCRTELEIVLLPEMMAELGSGWKQKKKKAKMKFKCIIRESNTGLIDGNDEFYH